MKARCSGLFVIIPSIFGVEKGRFMGKHPFNEGTKLAKIFTILADGEWHCGKHELPGTQPAKAIRIIRQQNWGKL